MESRFLRGWRAYAGLHRTSGSTPGCADTGQGAATPPRGLALVEGVLTPPGRVDTGRGGIGTAARVDTGRGGVDTPGGVDTGRGGVDEVGWCAGMSWVVSMVESRRVSHVYRGRLYRRCHRWWDVGAGAGAVLLAYCCHGALPLGAVYPTLLPFSGAGFILSASASASAALPLPVRCTRCPRRLLRREGRSS